jgi:prepilin-type N-terminal cleavage/methylation domain-containing protein
MCSCDSRSRLVCAMVLHPRSTIRPPKSAFTLVELLVVITIIGILISLLLPAVQAAREAARRVQCQNHLKQLALGCLHHESAQGFLPTGGWAWTWQGDPDRGFDRRQPGGWIYNVLPYIEQQALHDMGQGMNASDKKTALAKVAQTPLDSLYCSARRPAVLYPTTWTPSNVDVVDSCARTDYAGNGGSSMEYGWDPGDLSAVDAPGFNGWPATSDRTNPWYADGIFYAASMVRLAQITDGTSNTYLLGEKYLSPDNYYNGQDPADNNSYCDGNDVDFIRFGLGYSPSQDRPGNGDWKGFGSAHPGAVNMVLCDGAIHSVSYTIDPSVHADLCSRNEGHVLDASKF